MGKTVLIVESPAKAKTIENYLGKGQYKVLASYGHVRDLIAKSGAVEPDNGFAMHYVPIERNAKHLDAIAKAVKSADTLYLATDPDREGEAISWHVLESLKAKGLLKDKKVGRVVFHQVTRKALQAAVDNPREIAMDLVDAQQARRALDYLVGFTLSPLLWKKVRRGLSAGRVQSPALRMIVERELEIEAFKSREYWHILADMAPKTGGFKARLTQYQGEKIEQFSIKDEAAATAAQTVLTQAAGDALTVKTVTKKSRKRNPAAPFTTSTLQQEAARKLGFTTARTMRIAQQLYEGIDVGEGGQVGLITYMRTDSVHLADEAVDDLRAMIAERFGKDALPDAPRQYKTKAKSAQEAHEAVRPTMPTRIPDEIRGSLSDEQFKLYQLIWRRAVACQMIHATIDTVAIDFACGEGNTFRANGSTIREPGFIAVYQEGADDVKAGQAGDEETLPPLEEGDAVPLEQIYGTQHFTEPPPRYGEASLVKALEEHGIGRPSTYASIISTLQQREYVELEKKRFHPTDVGRVVNKFLTEYFTQYVDYDFTAKLEDHLDAVARGEEQWVPLLENFWGPFNKQVEEIGETVKRSDVTQEKLDEKCPECDHELSIRLGRRGKFIGCTNFPECKYTRNIEGDGEEGDGASTEPEVVPDRKCPECESDLIIRMGRYGKFIGCSSYPKCKHIESLEQPVDTGVECPKCTKGTLMQRKSRRGKVFFSCAKYPKCDYAIWNTPVAEACPTCDWPVLTIKETKRSGREKVCPQKECDFKVAAPLEG